MWLHMIYIVAFTVLAFLAIANLIRNLMMLGIESQRTYPPRRSATGNGLGNSLGTPTHPELLDASGQVINEPLLVMRSMTVEDAREQLDAIFEASPGSTTESRDDV